MVRQMKIIGISGDCEHGSSVALLKDNELIYAESEERLSRIKCDGAFPHQALNNAIVLLNNDYEDLIFAAPGVSPHQIARFDNEITNAAKNWGGRIERVEHHLAHARCAVYCTDVSNGLVITADGQGDGVSTALWQCKENTLQRIWHNSLEDGSVGFFFAAITEYLGYQRLQDEGKVTALAASGIYQPILAKLMEQVIELRNTHGHPIIKLNPDFVGSWKINQPLATSKFNQLLKPFTPEDIASAAQNRIEILISELISLFTAKYDYKNICVAGGLFANVGLNRRLGELSTHRFLVAPPMGDEGLAVGAAVEVAHRYGQYPKHCKVMFLGTDSNNTNFEAVLSRYEQIKYFSSSTSVISLLSATLLANEEIVARCTGKGEFGPRALGNRSLLYRPDDISCRKWLNQSLGRDSIMPFAPCVRREDLSEVTHINPDKFGGLESMTMAVQTIPAFQKSCPAVVHEDGTIRIQVVTKESNNQLWEILYYFKELTGLPALLNTSLNRHGEPICGSLDDAIICSLASNIDFIIADSSLLLYHNSRNPEITSLVRELYHE
jgi:carbamoyltransferase